MYGVGRLDDVAFVGDVHGLAFLWVKVISIDTVVGATDDKK